uniref:Uncharacterized protein n=1 Tax=Eutreptiella gymnastica TaxID=73025 RepID=A0A7S1NQM1_9EUGL
MQLNQCPSFITNVGHGPRPGGMRQDRIVNVGWRHILVRACYHWGCLSPEPELRPLPCDGPEARRAPRMRRGPPFAESCVATENAARVVRMVRGPVPTPGYIPL